MGASVTTTEVTHRKAALQALKRCKPSLWRVRSVLSNSGYTRKSFFLGVRETFGFEITAQIAQSTGLQKFAGIHKRWPRCKKQDATEELRGAAQRQLAAPPSCFAGAAGQKILKTN